MSERAAQFDALYLESIDPWSFRTSAYERAKYRATLDALPRPRYGRVLEVGCSIGELSALLAGRADEVLGLDVSRIAVDEAMRSHADVPGLHFEVREMPREWPAGMRDLVVLSEILYFLEPDEIDALALCVASGLAPDGHCALVCWLGENDCTLDGDGAAERFIAAFARTAPVDVLAAVRTDAYRIDVLARRTHDSPRETRP